MGCTLSKCWGGGGKKPTKTYQSLVVHEGIGTEPARTLSWDADHVTESFESVYKAALKRFDLDHDTLGNIQELKRELSNNPQLVSLIKDYLSTSIETLNFFSFLDGCLREAHSTVYIAKRAVYLFESGSPAWAVLNDIEHLKAQDNPFHAFPKNSVDEVARLCELHSRHTQKLSEHEKDLNRKLGKVEYWKRIGSSVCRVAVVGLLIGSVVLAIMAAPPVAITILGLAGTATSLLDKEIDTALDDRKSSPEGERDTIVEVKKQTLVAMHELNSINALVEDVHDYVNSVDGYAGSPMEGGTDVEQKVVRMKIAMYGIKTKAKRLNKSVENMQKELKLRRENLRTAVATILMAVRSNQYECVACVKSL